MNRRDLMCIIGITLVLAAGCTPADEPEYTYRPGLGPCDDLLDPLIAAEESHHDTYDRDLFGGFDRDALLQHNLDTYGTYFSMYDGRSYDDPSEVEVDHTVALAEAWQSGAWDWDVDRLEAFGGDPRNLTLLTADVNQEKGAKDPADWLPPAGEVVIQVTYLRRWVEVKMIYELTVDGAEMAALYDLCLRLGGT